MVRKSGDPEVLDYNDLVMRLRPAAVSDPGPLSPGPPHLTDHALHPYPDPVTNISRSYFYGFFYYGFPLAGRDWRRTRE